MFTRLALAGSLLWVDEVIFLLCMRLVISLGIFFLELEFAVKILVNVFKPVLRIFFNGLIMLFGLDGDYVVLFFLLFVDISLVDKLREGA